jgi:hypothetical protein
MFYCQQIAYYVCGFHTAVLYQIQQLCTVQHNTLNVNAL